MGFEPQPLAIENNTGDFFADADYGPTTVTGYGQMVYWRGTEEIHVHKNLKHVTIVRNRDGQAIVPPGVHLIVVSRGRVKSAKLPGDFRPGCLPWTALDADFFDNARDGPTNVVGYAHNVHWRDTEGARVFEVAGPVTTIANRDGSGILPVGVHLEFFGRARIREDLLPDEFKPEILAADKNNDTFFRHARDGPAEIPGRGQMIYWRGAEVVHIQKHGGSGRILTIPNGQGRIPVGTVLIFMFTGKLIEEIAEGGGA